MEDYKQGYEIHQGRCEKKNNITLPQEINAMINLDNYVYRGK